MSFSDRITKDYTRIYLLIILSIAALLRLLFLAQFPQGYNCDESADGYEAYSILMTLRDRYGKFLPLFFKTLGNDYREAPFTYLIVPFLKLFGLNEFATRFPAALSGILTVLVLYYLAKEIFNRKIALLAALLLAINPWAIQYSRITYRVNLLPLFFCLGLLFFIKSFRNPKYLLISSPLFLFSLWTYSSARVFVSLFLIGAIAFYRKHLWQNKKETAIAFLISLPFFLLLVKFWISPEGMTRANATGLETNPALVLRDYLSYFNPSFLFFRGERDFSLNPTNLGGLYYFELITVAMGTFWLFKERRKEKNLLFLWLFLYPIPAALVGPESSLRTLIGTPIFAIFSGYGANRLIESFNVTRRKLFIVAAIFLVAASATIFLQRYFFKYPSQAAIHWQYGMKEAIAYAQKSSYNCVVFNSDTNSACFAIQDFIANVPFYTQYPPQQYQKSPIPPWIGGSKDKIYELGKYRLISISRSKNLNETCLYILRPEVISNFDAKGYNWKEVYAVKDKRGVEHFKLIEVSKANT